MFESEMVVVVAVECIQERECKHANKPLVKRKKDCVQDLPDHRLFPAPLTPPLVYSNGLDLLQVRAPASVVLQ